MKFLNICPIIVLITINLKTTFAQTYNTSQTLTENQKLARDIFRELIEINTTVNMGSTKAAVAMAARLKKMQASRKAPLAKPVHIFLIVLVPSFYTFPI